MKSFYPIIPQYAISEYNTLEDQNDIEGVKLGDSFSSVVVFRLHSELKLKFKHY